MATIHDLNEILLKFLYLISYAMVFVTTLVILTRMIQIFIKNANNGFAGFTNLLLNSNAVRSWWFVLFCLSLIVSQFLGNYLGR